MLEMVNIPDNNLKSKETERKFKYKKSEEVEVKQSLLTENDEEEDQLTITEKYNSLKEKYNFLKKIINTIKEFVGLFIFCVAYYYYYLSLEIVSKDKKNVRY